MVATAVAVLVISVWVFAVLLPRHAAKPAAVEPITVAGITRFAGTDYAGSVFWQAAIYGLPLLVLTRLGAAYAATFQMCALSALPNIVTQSVLSMARVQRNMAALFAIPTAIAVIVIALSWVLAPMWGPTGVGAAWLIGQAVVAICLLVQRRPRADRHLAGAAGPTT